MRQLIIPAELKGPSTDNDFVIDMFHQLNTQQYVDNVRRLDDYDQSLDIYKTADSAGVYIRFQPIGEEPHAMFRYYTQENDSVSRSSNIIVDSLIPKYYQTARFARALGNYFLRITDGENIVNNLGLHSAMQQRFYDYFSLALINGKLDYPNKSQLEIENLIVN